MSTDRTWQLSEARYDFARARRQGIRERILGRLGGSSADLLSYEDVREQLRARSSTYVGLRHIPLESITGSVGRTSDFTRNFLPRNMEDETRWTRVEVAMLSPGGVPPIEVYQIGDVYFVLDGNHRVSVARRLGSTHIDAYVTRVHTDVPLSPDVQPDDMILKAEYAEFLDHTGIKGLRPVADLSTSVPGQHPLLEEHIDVHRYYMGIDEQRPIPYPEAVAHWYDAVYMPVVRVIRSQHLLDDFCGCQTIERCWKRSMSGK